MDFGDVLKTLGSIPLAIGKQIASDPVGFITDELLGFDDFGRAMRYGGQGDFLRMLKSLGAGVFEAGSTLIPSGALLKGTKIAPKAIKAAELGFAADATLPAMRSAFLPTTRMIRGKEVPRISTAILSRIPGMTEVIGANVATQAPLRGLTTGGRRALQGFRAGETAQWLDAGNALSAGMGGPALGIGTAAGVQADIATALAQQQALARQRVLEYLMGGGLSAYGSI